jgi:predicted nucleotide-binding protein (sugar kinase/HSP70/actin superfamily)
MSLTLGIVWAIICTDVLQGLEYRTRPYELESGQTDKVVQESVELLCAAFRGRPGLRGYWRVMAWHVLTDHFTRALREIFRRFSEIGVDRLQPKPIVKITGEFFLQTVEGEPNYNIHRWLEREGAEVYPAPIATWLDYLIRVYIQRNREYVGIARGARLQIAKATGLAYLLRRSYDRLRSALGNVPHELPRQSELQRLASPFFHHRLSGGEGDMLIGKALWAHLQKKAHMICELSPYACLPNTMSIGAMAGVAGRYPDLLYAPIEIKGDAEVHALSRCQMILTDAKSRALAEFEQALAGRSRVEMRRRLEARPDLCRATGAITPRGWVGTAANLVANLA